MPCWVAGSLSRQFWRNSKNFFRSPFLKQTHKRALHGLHLCTWHFRDLSLAINEAARDLFELEIACHVGVHEDVGHFSGSDDEFGDEIDRKVLFASQFFRDDLVRLELLVQLRNGLVKEMLSTNRVMNTCVRSRLALSPP